MSLFSQFDTGGDGDLQVLWEDGDRIFCRGWRLRADGDRCPVLAVLLVAEHPPPASLTRLVHEYELKDEVDGAWAARPLELGHERGRTMLVLEDPGGEPLACLLGAPMEVSRFLRLAISIAVALGEAHNRGLVHKDIKPANILVNRAGAQVWLTGFGIASRLPRGRQAPEPPESIAGTLAYMAPEQTGRMNRSIDSRSDLYALGVTLYQMLTGHLPFTGSDPMEWVHCHIARRPVPPSERLQNVPVQVSALIMKLLAKTAEERYQTATGLERDLRRCLADWEAQRRIDDFPLGKHDMPARLLIAEKLYGRAREVDALLTAFDRVVKSGVQELVLVSGYSGIGKSAVVHELHKALVPPRGLFASGKFDQYKRDIPYSTLVQAFQGLVRSLLGKSEAELASWRQTLLETLGPNGQLMVDLVPELSLVIGEQPPVPELPPQDAQRRFQLVFRRFIGVFAQPEHPLALFLDDLQWLDAATLDLLEDLLTQTDVQHLLLIGAYRDNEVDAAHLLMHKLDAIKTAGGMITEIALAPLAHEDLGQFIADALRCEAQRAARLTQLVHEKTAGNPFFAIQFLYALAEEHLLAFEHSASRWTWDLERIRAKGYTDNVVDLMVGRLTRLSADTQRALQLLACLGTVAEISLLSIVLGTSTVQVEAALWSAVRQELVECLDGSYRFIHDRVREAAYSLIPEASRAADHLRIGRLLAAQTSPEQREEAIFEIVNQLNRGATLIRSEPERDQLAELNLIAGKRAKASAAYASALTYLVVGTTLLSEDCWERRHELIFALELNRTECEFLTGELAAAEQRLTMLSRRAATTVERATVVSLSADLYTTLGQNARAIAIGLDFLWHLGIHWSPHPTEEEARREYEQLLAKLGIRPIEELVGLPVMTDPASLATVDVLTKVFAAAMYTEANLACLVICRAVNLSLERGNCDGSTFAYVMLGAVAGARFGDYRAGFRFGQVGYELVEQRRLRGFQARVYNQFGTHVLPWTRHVRLNLDLLRRAFEVANRNGDLTFSAYSCHALTTNLLTAGDPLPDVQREVEHGLVVAEKTRFRVAIDLLTIQLGLIRTLRGLTPGFGSFDDAQPDECQIEHRLSGNPNLARAEFSYWTRKLQVHFLAGEYQSAVNAASRAESLLWIARFVLEAAEYHFYGALARAASCDSVASDQHGSHREAFIAHHRQLEIWAANCPENFEDRAALVGAEIARLEGRELDAERLYEQAIHSAHVNGFIHNEALANELAARFYAARGFEKIAHTYLRDARYGYLRWGADGKVRQLDQLYPQLSEMEPEPAPTSTIGAPIEHLDLATVIKVSQAVSGEIVLDKLLDTLMRTAIEQAGAELGLLILPREAEQRIAAEAITGDETIVVHLRDLPVTATALPKAIVQTVLRTREAVIVHDAAAEPAFAADPYIQQRQARSILCLPLLNQSKLIGVLYLENNLAPRVFTPARISVLRLVASQAAVALENTRLYHELTEREAKIRRLVDANIIGIFFWHLDGRILEANEAFLRIVGYDHEDLIAGHLRWTDLTPPEWRDRHDRWWIPELRRTGSVQPYEKEYFRKDGSRVPVLVGSTSLAETRDHGIGFVLDLTRRKRAEEDLRYHMQLLKTVTDNASSALYIVDPEGLGTFVNPALERMTGYRADELIGQIVHSRIHRTKPDGAPYPVHECPLMRALRQGHVLRGEDLFVRKDGTFFPIRYTASPILRDGVAAGSLIEVQDLTERKQAEQALHQAQADLAHVTRVMTMGELTASIAHEINQPLAALVTNANACLRWLAHQPPNLDETRASLLRMVRDGHRAGEVITRIRSLVKKSPPVKARLDLNDAIQEVLAIVDLEARRHAVLVQTELAAGLPPVRGDRVQLQQVVLNLVMNGIEAMKDVADWPRELWIRSHPYEASTILVAVQDSGIGFKIEKPERIFEAFYTTKAEGIGIGLSISRSIIEVHGGQLWHSTNIGHGVRFQFTLPADDGKRQV